VRLRRGGALRAAVPAGLLDGAPGGGHGRVWREILRGLEARRVRLVRAVPGRRARADVWLADGHAGADGLGEPLVVQVHEAPWGDPVLDPGFAAEMARRTGAAFAAATRVCTASNHARAEIEAAHAPRAVDLVPHGVDPAVFRPGAGPAPLDGPYVLFVGTVHPRKNLPALREAMAALAADGRPHALALVLSPAPDRPDSRALLDAARAELPGAPGRVRAFAALSDSGVAGLMAGAAAVCVPSRSEGFGLAALEAMACATPVVAANRGALPEVTGGAAVLVEPDAAGVRAGLERVLDDPSLADELRAAGLARAAGLTWAASAAGWHRSLERAADTGG